jgi:hypothetical protein
MLGGWAQQGTQRVFSGLFKLSPFEVGRCKTTRKILIQEAFKDLSWEDNCLTIILGILFRNKRFFKISTQRSYLTIDSGKEV